MPKEKWFFVGEFMHLGGWDIVRGFWGCSFGMVIFLHISVGFLRHVRPEILRRRLLCLRAFGEANLFLLFYDSVGN